MFGNCPRAIWARWSPPDEEYRIDLACRGLLVREASYVVGDEGYSRALAPIECEDPGPIHFVGDLIPGVPRIHTPLTMGSNRFPELLIDKRAELHVSN